MSASNSIHKIVAATLFFACLLTSSILLAGGGRVDAEGNLHLNFHFLYPPSVDEISRAQEQAWRASELICDATEGQMRIATMRISAGGASESVGDIWYYPPGALNRPHSDGGPLDNPAKRNYLSGSSIRSDVFAHELGHLVFGLGDLYNEQRRFGDACGNGPAFDVGDTDEQNHSLMQQQGIQQCVTATQEQTGRACYNASDCNAGETCPLPLLSSEFAVEGNFDNLMGDSVLPANTCPAPRRGRELRVGGFVRLGTAVAAFDGTDFETAKSSSPAEFSVDYIDEIGLVNAYDEDSAHAIWVFSEHTGSQTWRFHFGIDQKHITNGEPGKSLNLGTCEIEFESNTSLSVAYPGIGNVDHRRVATVNGTPVAQGPSCDIFIDNFANSAGPVFLSVTFGELFERDSNSSGGDLSNRQDSIFKAFSSGTQILAAGGVQQLGACGAEGDVVQDAIDSKACEQRWNTGTERWETTQVSREALDKDQKPSADWTRLAANVQSWYGLTLDVPYLPLAIEPEGCKIEPVWYPEISGTDQVMMVLDRSGSMSETLDQQGDTRTRLEWAQAGARGFVTLQKGNGVGVGLISFATTATPELSVHPVVEDGTGTPNDHEEEVLHTAINGLEPNGSTAIGDALVAARDELVATQNGRTQAILLLSDGENNAGTHDVDTVRAELENGVKKIIVYSVPLGNAADGESMAAIADQTGGETHKAESGMELPTIFADLYARLRGETPLFTRTPISLQPGPTAGGPGPAIKVKIPVETDAKRLNLMLSNANDSGVTWNPGFELIDPQGTTVLNDQNASVAVDAFFKIARVNEPAPGNWTLRLFSNVPYPQDLAYWVHLENSHPDCWAGVDPIIVKSSTQKPHISATSSWDGPLGRGVNYSARIKGPFGFEATLPLSHDPEIGGGTALLGDVLPGRGVYDVVVRCEATADARFAPGEHADAHSVAEQGRPTSFVREARTAFFLDVPPTYVATPGGDCDHDGIPDSIDGPLTDTDGDGVNNYCDSDADGDDVPDANEPPGDLDGDGIPNFLDRDRDNDGLLDGVDNCPNKPNPNQEDTDGNGIGDACDTAPVNTPPIANAGADRTINTFSANGAKVTLDGSASSDADNDPLTYLWQSAIGNANGVKPTITLPPGTHNITLTVNDGHGGVSSDTVVIKIVYLGDVDCFFAWAEQSYPAYFTPAGATTIFLNTYAYRYYPTTTFYLAANSTDANVYYKIGSKAPVNIGPLANWLTRSNCQ